MGIKCGVNKILALLGRGLFNLYPKRYNIYVDGEFIRFKGLVEDNMSRNDSEERIAATSYDYLQGIVHNIERLLGRDADNVIVFLDGVRVQNKSLRRADFTYDPTLVRTVFKMLCREHAKTVIELDVGESELEMYLRRDQNVDLNVFITSDSDMLSICYDHSAECNVDPSEYVVSKLDPDEPITNFNMHYPKGSNVRDSCVWVRCCKNITCYGMDNLKERMIFSKQAFRQFIALCGTDFTVNILTETMICGILNASIEEKKFINSLTNIHDVCAALIYLGFKNGGTSKRSNPNSKPFNPKAFSEDIQQYIKYIETGKMSERVMTQSDPYSVLSHYLQHMTGCDEIKKGVIKTWANRVPIQKAIENFKYQRRQSLKLKQGKIFEDGESETEGDFVNEVETTSSLSQIESTNQEESANSEQTDMLNQKKPKQPQNVDDDCFTQSSLYVPIKPKRPELEDEVEPKHAGDSLKRKHLDEDEKIKPKQPKLDDDQMSDGENPFLSLLPQTSKPANGVESDRSTFEDLIMKLRE